MLIFVLLNIAVSFCAYLLLKAYFDFKDPLDNILGFSILFCAQIILTLTCLGFLNLLYLNNILFINAFVLASLLFFFLKIAPIKNLSFANPFKKLTELKLDRLELFCLAVILGFGLVKIAINLVNPPFGWDCLNYHFTFPVEWLKHGNLQNPIVVNDYPAPSYYPINGSLFYFWLMLPFKSVFMADLGQLPFFIIAFIAILSISKKIGINRNYAFFAAALFSITPNYFKQIEIAYVDIMAAALFLCSINFLLCFCDGPQFKALFLFSLSTGLLFGVKILNVAYIPLFFVWLVILLSLKHDKIKLKTSFIYLCLFLILVTGLGGFSYLKNWILTKNFLYPLDLSVFGFRVFNGVMTSSYPVKDLDFGLIKLLFHEGMGAGTILFVIPGLLLAFGRILKGKIKINTKIVILFSFIPALYLIYRYLIRLPNARYLYALLGICYIIAFLGLESFKVPKKVTNIFVVVCFLASISELAGYLELIIALALSLLLFLFFAFLNKQLHVFSRPAILLPFFLLVYFSFSFLSHYYEKNEYPRYEKSLDYSGFWPDAVRAWIWLNHNTTGNNIAYVGRPVPFPLYGSNFKNNAYYVSVNEIEPSMLHKYKNSSYVWGDDHESLHQSLQNYNNYRGRADYDIWLKNLLKRNTDFLFIYSLHQTKKIDFPFEDSWANSQPRLFNLVFKNDTVHIYRIIK